MGTPEYPTCSSRVPGRAWGTWFGSCLIANGRLPVLDHGDHVRIAAILSFYGKLRVSNLSKSKLLRDDPLGGRGLRQKAIHNTILLSIYKGYC